MQVHIHLARWNLTSALYEKGYYNQCCRVCMDLGSALAVIEKRVFSLWLLFEGHQTHRTARGRKIGVKSLQVALWWRVAMLARSALTFCFLNGSVLEATGRLLMRRFSVGRRVMEDGSVQMILRRAGVRCLTAVVEAIVGKVPAGLVDSNAVSEDLDGRALERCIHAGRCRFASNMEA